MTNQRWLAATGVFALALLSASPTSVGFFGQVSYALTDTPECQGTNNNHFVIEGAILRWSESTAPRGPGKYIICITATTAPGAIQEWSHG